MKKRYYIIVIFLTAFAFVGCGNKSEGPEEMTAQDIIKAEVQPEIVSLDEGDLLEEVKDETSIIEKNETEQMKMKIQIGDNAFTVTMAGNSSAEALLDRLKEGPISIEMQDYANMEKVGSLGASLPRNDEQMTTEPGDIILYQGNALVIYYAPNSWNFTRIGKIDDVTQPELKEVLGEGDVTVTLSLE